MSDQSQPTRFPLIRLLLVFLPLAAILVSFVLIASLDPLRGFNNGAPPVESLTVERTILDSTGIHPTFGEVKLRQLLATWAAHDLGHLTQITRVMCKQYRTEVGPWKEFISVLR